MEPVNVITYINGYKIYPKGWLPNTEGYKFLSVLSNGNIIEDVVIKNPITGLHTINTWVDCIGFIPLNIHKTF